MFLFLLEEIILFVRLCIQLLYHAINHGMDMGIVNAGMIEVYENIPRDYCKQ